ncbi:MAG: cell division topological specificity factor MinE [Gammaproteobacteria bacterium]|nr:cell division topological specificity factor MinE [Gammaproteobacteria bacterium]
MSLMNRFRSSKAKSASVAKDRLKIIVAHERKERNQPDYLPAMQQELIDVIKKYIAIDEEQVHISLQNTNNCSVFELNVTLPG